MATLVKLSKVFCSLVYFIILRAVSGSTIGFGNGTVNKIGKYRTRDDMYSMNKSNYTSKILQKCRDRGEAYAASYLINVKHLLFHFTNYNLSSTTCEMGSFMMMNGRANPMRNKNGSIVQSIDVLDFSVIHLSAYERLLRRYQQKANSSYSNLTIPTTSTHPISTSISILKNSERHLHPKLNHTLVIMPYLGSEMGVGHSIPINRQKYIEACFWSLYNYFPYIVVGVMHESDRDYLR